MSSVQAPARSESQAAPTNGRRYYILALLTFAYVFNFIDRQIIAILQDPIKAEFSLSDTQLGLLNGFAFALFYVGFGLPLARWADAGNRRNLLAWAVALWSLMTALCGLAQNYVQLLLARMGVGVGEAGCSPAAHSMISDLFPADQRATALGVYSVGVNVGILAGFIAGGWLNEVYGWRVALMAVGLPGLLLALWIRISVPEPERLGAVTESLVSFKQVLMHLWSLRSARWLALGCGLTSVAGYGLANWMPSFLIRSHGMGTAELGVWLALIAGVGGGLGTFLGGLLADRLGQRDPRWPLWLPAGVLCIALPFLVLTFLLPSKLPALLIYIFPASVISCYLAPAIAVLHGLAPNRMRAMASAMLFLVINIIGLGLGPVAIGLFSDLLSASLGAESLRYALLTIVCAGTAAGAGCFLVAARYLPSRPVVDGSAV